MLLGGGCVRAQDIDLDTNPDFDESFDPTYITDLSHLMLLRGYSSLRTNSLRLVDRAANDRFQYIPNNNFIFGAGFNYQWLGVNIGFRLPVFTRNAERFGTTRAIDLQANTYGRRTGYDIILQTYRGFYLGRPNRFDPNWQRGQSFPQRADLRVRTIGGRFYYCFNYRQFSYRAAFVQSELQRKNAGSFIAGTYLRLHFVRADSSLVPIPNSERFSEEASLRFGNFQGFGIIGGYVYTFVIQEHWFATVSLTLDPGLALSQTRYGPTSDLQRRGLLKLATDGRISLGYNSEAFFAGFFYTLSSYGFTYADQQQVQFDISNLRFSYVRRIDYPFKWNPIKENSPGDYLGEQYKKWRQRTRR